MTEISRKLQPNVIKSQSIGNFICILLTISNKKCKKPRLESGAAMKRMFNAFLDSKKLL